MKSATIALLLFATSAPAFAADWRLVVTDEEGSLATFVDVDSIRPAADQIRTVSSLNVRLEADEEGVAAENVDLRVDCTDRRFSIYRIVLFDEDNEETGASDLDRPWVGPFDEETQGRALVDFVCGNGASDPSSESWGSERPFDEARRAMRERAQKK